jgi:hypothetical protein
MAYDALGLPQILTNHNNTFEAKQNWPSQLADAKSGKGDLTQFHYQSAIRSLVN